MFSEVSHVLFTAYISRFFWKMMLLQQGECKVKTEQVAVVGPLDVWPTAEGT